MPVIVKCWQVAVPDLKECVGRYLEFWNVDAFKGYGAATWTKNIAHAKRFDDETQAVREWNAVPGARLKRDDGSANQPLHAWGIEFETVNDEPPPAPPPLKPTATHGGAKPAVRRKR